jgi:uncharacterized protein YggE
MKARLAALVAVLSLTLAPAALADAPSTLSVNATGQVFVTPDVATITVEVVRSAPASRAALSAANRRVASVVAALRAVGVAQSAIQTTSVSVSRSTVRVGPHRRRATRFTATENLSARITSIKSVGPAIDAATRAGADSVNGPSFSFADPAAGQIAANAAALAAARRQADAAAAAIGYHVTGVQSVALNPQPSSPLGGFGGSSAAPVAPKPATPTNIQPGVLEVDATATVVYTIAPG